MAGIGFKMQKLFKEDYFSSRIKAYSFAGLITAGPWIIVIVTVALIQAIIRSFTNIPDDTRELFVISISYSFIFSQVIFGMKQLIVTRYLADLFYVENFKDVFPTFIGSTKVVIFLALFLWGIFCVLSPLPLLYKVLLLILFITLNVIWILFTFLTAAKYYQPVALSFLFGGITTIVAIYGSVNLLPFESYSHYFKAFILLSGFTAGMVVTLYILLYALLISFPDKGVKNQFNYLQYYDKYPSLFWNGFLYNMAIWVCNWVIWFGSGSILLEATFRFHRFYDTAIFWSYLTIIPTMVIFVISIETRFYSRYRSFYGYINRGGSLSQIQQAKYQMQRVLKQEMERLLRNQGLFSFTILLLAPFFISYLLLPKEFLTIFRLTLVGAFSNAMVLVVNLLLLYFEDRKGALLTVVILFASNLILSLLFLPFGDGYYGLSFAIGCSLSFAYGSWRLISYVSEIDYFAFTGQGVRHKKSRYEIFTKIGRFLNEKFV
ncbi:exopolysaccharide Pel transporter PelG [Bacillus salitolerans]|uniref:Exopolysaccharide Pel transporter PelG n=1 Tax=Bacillus salitolerans TaxID=1437434 RepID=A0ABW4LM77_9BACI